MKRPKVPESVIRALCATHHIDTLHEVVLVGIRGYYRDTMGKVGENDRGIYDDAIFIVGPGHFSAWNANTDPSAFRSGIAKLKAGKWRYKVGIHGLSKPKDLQYKAFIQAAAVTVIRDGRGEDTGWFGINIHRGGINSTSSLGCQTIYSPDWIDFFATATAQMSRNNQQEITYLLVEGPVV